MENSEGKSKPKKSQDEAPIVYVIAGSNGAGKSTFATEFLPDFANCSEFLNADLIAARLSPCAPETQNVRAGRLLLIRIKELTAAKGTFGFETTLSGCGYVPSIDNGVLLNMAPLWELIPSWQGEPRKAWEASERGDYGWAYQAMDHWPERVKKKCKTNKSYAVAHGLA